MKCDVTSAEFCRTVMKYHTSLRFDVHRAVHRNIISILKPTRCSSVSNLFYFGITLYMFHTVFPSIIRNSRLYIQQQACFLFHLASKIIFKTCPKMATYTPQILKIQHRTLSQVLHTCHSKSFPLKNAKNGHSE